MRRPSRFALALFAALACAGGPARGDGVVADLSSHLIAITTGFTGASVVLFGATEGRGDTCEQTEHQYAPEPGRRCRASSQLAPMPAPEAPAKYAPNHEHADVEQESGHHAGVESRP